MLNLGSLHPGPKHINFKTCSYGRNRYSGKQINSEVYHLNRLIVTRLYTFANFLHQIKRGVFGLAMAETVAVNRGLLQGF